MTKRMTKALKENIAHLEENIAHMEALGLPWEVRKLRKRMQELLAH